MSGLPFNKEVIAESEKCRNESFGMNQNEETKTTNDQRTSINDIVLKSTNEVVKALEKELNERKEKIVTSFQLIELNNSTKAVRKSAFKSNFVIWNRAEEHFSNGSNEKDNVKCISSLTKAISLKPMECKYYIKRGEKYLQICDFQSAILNYKKACILDPDNDEHYSKLALIYYIKGQCLFDYKNYEEALKSFSRAAEMKPDVLSYHTRSVACLAALQRYDDCLALVNKRLNIESDNSDLLIMRSRLHQCFGNDSFCYYDLIEALQLDPEHNEGKTMLANVKNKAEELKQEGVKLQILGNLKEALIKFSNAVKTNPESVEYLIYRGAVHRQLSNFNSAIDDYILAMSKSDHDSNKQLYKDANKQLLLCYNDFAVECFSKGFYDEAIVLLNKAIKEEKNEKGLYINRGDCFFRTFEFNFALNDYNQALELDPKDSSIKVRLSVVYNELGLLSYTDKRYDDAYQYFDVAIGYNPKVAIYYTSRARARYMLEDYEGAKYDVTCCLSLEPSNRSVMSLFSRLFPQKSVQDVLESANGIEAAEMVRKAISSSFPSLIPNYLLQFKGSKDLSLKTVLPPINEQKLNTCLTEKDFCMNNNTTLQSLRKVKKTFIDRKSLHHKGKRVSKNGMNKQQSIQRHPFGNGDGIDKPVVNHKTSFKIGTKQIAFMKA
ncbi:tetratricopeptide repeat protein 16-like [Xenia sp. Carnegie-2017]|uniref:tetratricopeptide repeat protein 16-like n=1 Tax=Xenia sp. Carnegie-2017 TaxID=2897299 RepID=UPI001F03348D|nr:tetratricopeptide repeat protein 16-like [Xenia sp. Carnegie-2017]